MKTATSTGIGNMSIKYN